jgi:hypothetical protein
MIIRGVSEGTRLVGNIHSIIETEGTPQISELGPDMGDSLIHRMDAPNTAEPHPSHSHDEMIVAWRWRDYLNIVLGVWLLLSPMSFGYVSPAMMWNDIICGMLIVAFATAALAPRLDLMRWGVCAVGLWLLLAPLVFWAPQASAYANDTLVGALVIAFSVLIPMMPGRAHHEVMMLPGPEIPPGWSYNPSGWIQRGPIIAMAFVGYFISRYLAAYQLGHITYPWDPFFGDGTQRILDSDVSKAWPISDAGLGAASYMLEALSGFMGGVTRWRTMPWMVLMFGILVIPLGVVSIVLVILQPVAVGAWCALCLVTAAAMLIMIAPALDEVIAMVQFLIQARREGQPLWRTFWLGGTLCESQVKDQTSESKDLLTPRESTLRQILQAMDLTSIPWNIAACALLGVWLMFSPTIFASTGMASDSDHLVGALVVTFSVIAFGQIARLVRLLNVLLGAWLIAAPWIVEGFTATGTWNDVAAGAALIALSLRRGKVNERYGGWERYIV